MYVLQATTTFLLLLTSFVQAQQIQFNPTSYFIDFNEEQPQNTTVTEVGAAYLDSFGRLLTDGTFSIPSTGDAQFFSMETTSNPTQSRGIIRSRAVFDRDFPNAQVEFSFVVTYTTPDSTTATVPVNVFLQDINDNAPQFSQSLYTVPLLEDTPPGTTFFTPEATDPDLTLRQQVVIDIGPNLQDIVDVYTVSNGRILYEITDGNSLRHFVLNQETAALSVRSGVQLDIDAVDLYNLTIVATDGGGLNDTAYVVINVLDANDNAPQILGPLGVNLTISEDTPTGYIVVDHINATDLDRGVNAEIRFLITSGDLMGIFSINEESGEISVSAPLDRERGAVVELTVAARDRGIPQALETTMQVVIHLLDINDFTPQFSQPSYTVSVMENQSPLTTVERIEAIDLDKGPNGTLNYTILQGGEGIFEIDPSTGTIRTLVPLDREERESYELIVQASDSPLNSSYQLSSQVNVTILVGDVNDNPPIFQRSEYNASILDNQLRRVEILRVVATDADTGSNGRITYTISTPDPTDPGRFLVNETTGVIYRERRVIFENQNVYNFTVQALDGEPSFPLVDTTQVTIFIHNVNENPPVFDQPEYNTTLVETTNISTVVLTVSASDDDVGLIGEVRYRNVTDFDKAGSFGVNETSGEVFVSSRLDFDFRDFVFFVIEAYDGGFPEPYTDRTNITVYLVGENDEAPSINFPDEMFPTVPENESPGIEFVELRQFTSDPDPGPGGEFSFRLVEIFDEYSQNDSFSFNETTGVLTSLRTFDREQQPDGIVVAIETIDNGDPQQSQVINITVIIRDKNDNAPYFETNATAEVYEFMPPGIQVPLNYTALDDDIGSNAKLEYDIFAGKGAERFSIDPVTGIISTTEILNKTVQQFYNLTIIATDQGMVPMFGFGYVFIEVIDANDQVPMFSEKVYNSSLHENADIGTFVAQVNATDSDIGTNANFEYFIHQNSSSFGLFTINSTSGEIFSNAIFDRENISYVDIDVIAIDNGLVPLTGSTTVRVTIADINDNTPVFNETLYFANVTENAPNSTVIATVLAQDSDAQAPNNVIMYTLLGERSENFVVDSSTGNVLVAGEVDWEQGAEFTLIVVATDGGSPPRLATANLTIYIEDVNDVAPRFLPSSLNLSIFENTEPGNTAGSVEAFDLDSPGNNSEVFYTVLLDFSGGRFELDSNTGLVTFVQGSLDRERRDLYDLSIRASDHGNPQLHTDATLYISVTDSNEFSPVFEQEVFQGSVAERAEIGTSVLTLRATDVDVDLNGELRYSIDASFEHLFQVDNVTGVISTSSELLDFEMEDRYSFEVAVTDLGYPDRFNDTARVVITILDSNDNQPLFNAPLYSGSLRENLASGTTLLQVGATDADSGTNAEIEYTLPQGVSEYLGIDPLTGVLYTRQSLNHEVTPQFSFLVTAHNSEASYPLNSTTEVLINVTDLNDMHPTFDLVTNLYVAEDTDMGSVIYTLAPDDGDEGLNGTVTFTLIIGDEGGNFELDEESGNITLLRALDFEKRDLYILSVMATDFRNLSNYTNVLIHIVDINDNPPQFLSGMVSTTVSFAATVGSFVANFQAVDADSGTNAELQYSILSGNELGLFELASTNEGIIQTADSLSAFRGMTFTLMLNVSNPGHQGLSDIASVAIHIHSGQASAPRFDSQNFTATLAENSPADTEIFDFGGMADNVDTYSINSTDYFDIDATNGIVTLGSTFTPDFESQRIFFVTVEGRSTVSSEVVYTVLKIEITDENEHIPQFISDSFFIALPETTPISEPFFISMATDKDDSSPANDISYSITTSDPVITSQFGINTRTGGLFLRRALNYEAGDREFNFTISAENDPSTISEANVSIIVLNGNSFSPVFNPTFYSVNLLEDVEVELNIVSASATDNDDGSQGDITYGLHGNHDYRDFRIDTYTGQIFINYPLDYERHTSYTLEIVASDGGNPVRSSIATLLIEIQDLNDNTPVWESTQYSVTVFENVTMGMRLITVLATDEDQVDRDTFGNVYVDNGLVSYSIEAGDSLGQFMITTDTGIVRVVSPLNREETAEYNLMLRATDGGGLFSESYLHIVLTDVNDQVPVFPESPYIVGLPENSPNDTLVLTVMANDTDLGAGSEIAYHFSGSNGTNFDSSGTFYLNNITGEILLTMPIDREAISEYVLSVEAVDMGTTPLTGVVEVKVQVIDINEFAPVFNASVYNGSIHENEPMGTSVLQVFSSDLDYEENSTVMYSIIEGHSLNLFIIAPDTGLIEVNEAIDFELVQEVMLVVMATDTGPIETRLTSEVNVTISILDRNDNAPLLEDSYTASIPEDAVPGDVVLVVFGEDLDSGANAEITYSLDPLGNPEVEGNFVIDPFDGVVSLSNFSVLEREVTPNYTFLINATDGGSPSMQSSAPVTVLILDINDNVPQFTADFFQGSLLENSPSAPLATVEATDKDVGPNAVVVYSISRLVQNKTDCLDVCASPSPCGGLGNQTLSNEIPFFIDPQTGLMFSTQPLDRETIASYVLLVQATDLAVNETQLSNTTCLLIEVLDENDNVPIFSQDIYMANISEFTSMGEQVHQVFAEDLDSMLNAEIEFEILTESDSFTINPSNGVIRTLIGTYDREARDQYNLTVVARDQGAMPLSSSAVVMVTILDENDNLPMFSQSLYTANVLENQPMDTVVFQATANDLDIGSNAELSYSITSVTPPLDHFVINSTTGELSTTQPLDREDVESYVVTVTSVDGGSPQLVGNTTINVLVQDENDLPPLFTNVPYVAEIDENTLFSGPLLAVTAQDGDIGTNAEIYYTLVGVIPQIDAFEVNITTGEISVTSELDAEYSLNYTLIVNASNGDARPMQLSQITVDVQVTDLNDNSPFFEQSDYVIPLLESTPIDDEVITLRAFDNDATNENADLSFEITGGQNQSLFEINATTGVVYVAGQLDRESEHEHELEITVSDNGQPQMNATTTLTIILQDFNDNSPVFQQSSYSFSISENLPSLSLVGQIRATDLDIQTVSYSLANTTLFQVNSTSGEVFTSAPLDREEQETYSFVAIATDEGSTIQRSAEVTVNVTLRDLNDVAPYFPNTTYIVSVLENTTVGSVLLTVEAIDEDLDQNSILRYSLLPGNDSAFFSVNSTSGEIILEAMFDREMQDEFLISVSASDLGSPSLNGTAAVLIRILDNNDNVPMLNASEYRMSIDEDAINGTMVLSVGAIDRDIDENADIDFSLSETFGGLFTIGGKSGVLRLTGSLDFELVQNYSLSVIATDNGESPLSSDSMVFVEVLDLNDNPPLFDSDAFTVSIPENAILDTSVFQIPATDADSTTNSELRYTILSGNLGGVFEVDEIFGLISTSDYLDREVTPAYSLGLRVVDLGTPQFTSTTVLEVIIEDVNDNPPQFESNTYPVFIPETLEIETEFLTVMASDLDSDSNANLSYSIIEGNADRSFQINSYSGSISTTQLLDFETRPSYTLILSVSDNGYPSALTDTAMVLISLSDVNEHPPLLINAVYYVNVSENAVLGSPIGYLHATDEDLTSEIEYTIINRPMFFDVDPMVGTMLVSSALEPGTYIFTVQASDQDYRTNVTVHVTVVPLLKANTIPLFSQPAFLFEVSESVDVGHVVGPVSDREVEIVGGSDKFTVDQNGRLVLIGRLDYEDTPTFVLNVNLTYLDTEPPLFAIVTVIVMDENDNAPVFESSQYNIVISELTPIDTALLTLRILDYDSPGVNSQVNLTFSGRNEAEKFAIDPHTGELVLENSLDYEDQTVYNLTVTATNYLATPTLSGSAQVIVEVTDVNDNDPIFSQTIYRTQISESTPFGMEILRLEAEDFDSGTNSELVFAATHLNIPLSFVINTTTGAVLTNTTFNLTQDVTSSYVISALVSDRGTPQPRSDTTTIFIEVAPDNRYPPQFSQPSGYQVDVPETVAIGYDVIKVIATDPDDPLDSMLEYSIVSGGQGKFTINPSTGLIETTAPLDFSEQSVYTLSVGVVDFGLPPRTSFVGVNISLIDINDHSPQFIGTPYKVQVIENITIGTFLLQVNATDPDTVNITYQITVNVQDNGVSLFTINSTSGEIHTAGVIDREFGDVLEILVSAIDSGYNVRRSQSVPVRVIVQDLNDSPPVFTQAVFNFPTVRFLGPNQSVGQVTAVEPDIVGASLVYAISNDTSGGLFKIDPASGLISTVSMVPVTLLPSFELNVTAFDGVFTSSVGVVIQLVDDGEFCNSVGFCTIVKEVNCTFDVFPFVDCNAFCLGEFELYPASTGSYNPLPRVCISRYCMDTAFVPCIAMETCLPPNRACAGVCPVGMSVCPTTDTCRMTSITESCDQSNETCLSGQTLVQRIDNSRYCAPSESLPLPAQNCTTQGSVFCETVSECQNLTHPYLCQACPADLVLCMDTGKCASDAVRCCGASGYYCDVLSQCLDIGQRCDLPNIAPVIASSLIYLETEEVFEPDRLNEGHVIATLLGNSTQPAVDVQGEEISIAIVQASSIQPLYGEWQYALCEDYPLDMAFSECSNLASWVPIDASVLSETNALVLPNTARVRFLRRAIELDGGVWLRVKLWDGNTDGFVSNTTDLVRSASPKFESTLPRTPTSAFSENTTLLAIVILPLISPPVFNAEAPLQLSSIQEDIVFASNLGNQLTEIVLSVEIPSFQVLAEDRIEGFEDVSSPAQSPEALLPVSVRDAYYRQVALVNPTRMERQTAAELGQSPGVAISFASESQAGTWQVTLDQDPRMFVNLSSLLGEFGNGEILLLNTMARLRFLPSNEFCGSEFILVRPWDGYWNQDVVPSLENGFVVVTAPAESNPPSPALSSNNLNKWMMVEINVECEPDKPVLQVDQVLLDPIPYRIAYRYERVFTVLIDRDEAVVRNEGDRLSDFLQITLQVPMSIKKLSAAVNNKTSVSFTVEGDVFTFNEVRSLIEIRMDTLAMLGFTVKDILQDVSYGPGAGCYGDQPQHYHGVHVNSFFSQFASDGDNNFVGVAMVGMDTSDNGVWQYHRGNWSSNENRESDFDPLANVWINFPSPNERQLSDTNALLLHGNDRLRYLPHPDRFWTSDSAPSIRVKIWDGSMGTQTPSSEISAYNINTNPTVDTVQSLLYPQGRFSDRVLVVSASRLGCDGVVSSALVHDACCVCGGTGDSCEGCDGVVGSNVMRDACDVCGPALESDCLGCDFIPFSETEPGQCGECLSTVLIPTNASMEDFLSLAATFTDCNNSCYGSAVLDACAVCSGGNTLHEPNSDVDCAGVCFGEAVIDTCGDCTGSGTSLLFNQNMDCTSVCNGPFVTDTCGVCQLTNQNGEITENRDCAGVCYGEASRDVCNQCVGGTTNLTAGYTIDACGVCEGDNSSCVGCDGAIASGLTIDSCGECGGNNCGCFRVDSIAPIRGPRTGGTEITIRGAGFFLNDTDRLQFTFDREAPNCGAPYTFPDAIGSTVRITCQFRFADQQLQALAFPVDQSTIRCITQPTIQDIGQFLVDVRFEDGPFSDPIPFLYEDYSNVTVSAIIPSALEINTDDSISISGSNFINTGSQACLLYDFDQCGDTQTSNSNPLVIPAMFVSKSEVRCQLPAAGIPCQVTVRLSLDGQESGIIDTTQTMFTYGYGPPRVESVHFTTDLAHLMVQFDRQVELAPTSPLTCSDIFTPETFSLIGGEAAECRWADNSQQELVISLPRSASVEVNSQISFIDEAILTRNQLYSFAVRDTVFVNPIRNAVRPNAVLNGPTSIPSCGQVSFSGIHSQFPGYKGFEYHWAVHVADSTIANYSSIVSAVDSYGLDSPSITLDSDLFLPDFQYYLQLYVVNSIGLQSETESLLLLKDINPRPVVLIPGTNPRMLNPGEDLVIESSLVPPQCTSSPQAYNYTWTLTQIINERQGITSEVDLSLLRISSPSIIIPESYFTFSTDYILTVQVTSDGQPEPIQAEVRVSILPPALQAQIRGGDRVVSHAREVVLDGRTSTYDSSVRLSWSCQVVGSLDACYNRTQAGLIPVPIMLPMNDFVSFPASDLESGRQYIFNLILEQGEESSQASMIIEIVTGQLPIVEITSPNVVVSSEAIFLEGLVFTSVPVESVTWESLELIGQGTVDLTGPAIVQSQITYEATPSFTDTTSISSYPSIPLLTTVQTNTTSRANLALSPYVLTPGLTYTFRLTAVTNQGTAYSQVTLTPTSPPLRTTLQVTPTTGVALETMFELEAINTVDTTGGSPFLYAFGIVDDSSIDISATSVPDEVITWVSAIRPFSTFTSLLPASNNGTSLRVLTRVFNRFGATADAMVDLNVLSNSGLDQEAHYTDFLSEVSNHLADTKDWTSALSNLIAVSRELSNPNFTDTNIREQILEIFIQIFESYLPPSVTNYQLSASLLTYLTTNGSVTNTAYQAEVADIVSDMLQWFDSELVFEQLSSSIPAQNGEPLYLQSSYSRTTQGLVTDSLAANLIQPLTNILAASSAPELSMAYVQNIDLLTQLLCKEKLSGQEASQLSTQLVDIYGILAQPNGAFNVSGVLINFQDLLTDLFLTEACSLANTPCLETCVSGVLFESDLLGDANSSNLQLTNNTSDTLISEIEGSNPFSVEIFSDIISTSVSIPSHDSYLLVSNLDSSVQILIPVREPIPNGSQPLCLYRNVGGGSGFDNTAWQLDTIQPPPVITLSGMDYFMCEFNHLTEFVVGLLPPPVITTPPPMTTPSPTTMETTTEMTTPPPPTTTEPTTLPPAPEQSPVGAIVAVIIIVLIIVVIVVALLIGFFVWKKKRSKKLQIQPGSEETDGGTTKAELLRAGPLTPEESKVPMQIILCAESGDRKLIGKMNVLPSIRLRELRYQLADNFDMFKNKPFYFLTRQLCDIEPAAEQQQFVSLVFGDKPIFVREVSVENELTKKHFCICGNAAQFECSNCSTQGYCSPECQLKHWGEQHQRQCNRLSEKRRRSDILSSRQGQSTATSPDTQRPRGLGGLSRRVTLATMPNSGDKSAISPTTPTDWKGFMSAGKSFQQQPSSQQRSVSAAAMTSPSGEGESSRPRLVHQDTPRAQLNLGPLKKVSVPARTLPPLSRSASLQGYPQLASRPSFQAPTPGAPVSRPSFQTPTPGVPSRTRTPNFYGTLPTAQSTVPPSPLQQPVRSPPDLFTRTDPQQVTLRPQPPARRISISSIGSEDLGFSMSISHDLRHEPLLESDEEDYKTSSGSGDSSPSPRLLKPPSSVTPTPKTLGDESVTPSALTDSRTSPVKEQPPTEPTPPPAENEQPPTEPVTGESPTEQTMSDLPRPNSSQQNDGEDKSSVEPSVDTDKQ